MRRGQRPPHAPGGRAGGASHGGGGDPAGLGFLRLLATQLGWQCQLAGWGLFFTLFLLTLRRYWNEMHVPQELHCSRASWARVVDTGAAHVTRSDTALPAGPPVPRPAAQLTGQTTSQSHRRSVACTEHSRRPLRWLWGAQKSCCTGCPRNSPYSSRSGTTPGQERSLSRGTRVPLVPPQRSETHLPQHRPRSQGGGLCGVTR